MNIETRSTPLSRAREFILPGYLCFIIVALLIVSIVPARFVDPSMMKPSHQTLRSAIAGQANEASAERKLTAQTPPGATDEPTGNRLEVTARQSSDLQSAETVRRREETRASSEPNGLASQIMPLDFRIPDNDSKQLPGLSKPSGSILVRKPVYTNDELVGTLEITIDKTSRLLLDPRDVRALLGDNASFRNGLNQLPEQGLVSFRSLRDVGLDLRYSPTEDLIRLQ